MHEETLDIKTKKTLEKIQNEPVLTGFYLAGGTALALQLGHRRSVDLDFFSGNYPPHEQLLKALEKFSPTIAQQAYGTLDVFIDNVKVSFFEYKYPLLEETVRYKSIQLARLADIACMKISAIAQRGTKKDFTDLYFLLQKYSLGEILKFFEKKYQGYDYQKLHIIKSLVFFDDAENDPDPDFITKVGWDEIKRLITAAAI